MRELTIGKNDAGQRLDRFVAKNLPLLPPALLQKYIRIKRVKVNGRGAKRDARLCAGDILQLYINDEFFDKPKEENLFLSIFQPRLSIVYEDENLLLVDKRPGLVVHADETEKVNTLINHIQAYLYQKREWSPRDEHAFAPALCNRIDQRENPGPRAGEILSLRDGGPPPSGGGEDRGLSIKRRGEKAGGLLPPPRPRGEVRRHAVPDPGNPGRAVFSGVPVIDGADPSDSSIHGGNWVPPPGGWKIRRRRREPKIPGDPAGAVCL